MAKYHAWIGRNVESNLEVVDFVSENFTSPAGPHSGWNPLVCSTITVKFYGRAIL